MFKKSIISLLSLLIILSHAGQAQTKPSPATQVLLSLLKMHSHSRQAQTTLSPAAQAFFEPGNHDDTKLHMLGYLADSKNISSVIRKKGPFYKVLQNFVDLKDKTLKRILEKLLGFHSLEGKLDLNKALIALARMAILSKNEILRSLFLPEIFDAPEKPPTSNSKKWWHKLKRIFIKQKKKQETKQIFPDDLTSQRAKNKLKETTILDLALRTKQTDVAKIIVSKFWPEISFEDFMRNIEHYAEYAPMFVEYKKALKDKNIEKIKELVEKNAYINKFSYEIYTTFSANQLKEIYPNTSSRIAMILSMLYNQISTLYNKISTFNRTMILFFFSTPLLEYLINPIILDLIGGFYCLYILYLLCPLYPYILTITQAFLQPHQINLFMMNLIQATNNQVDKFFDFMK